MYTYVAYIKQYVSEEVGFVTFNLGYLPGSDKTIVTKSDTTIMAIKQSMEFLLRGGIIALTLYVGHQGGYLEAMDIESFLETIDKKQYKILKYQFLNRSNAPYSIIIEKQ